MNLHESLNLCEMCDKLEGTRREDNIFICEKCDDDLPIVKD